jgi:hypothetical protein
MHGRAKKLLEAEQYEEAEALYSEILKGDPEDADAIIGASQSREKLLDSKLIQVRLARIGGNAQSSLDQLLKVVELENEWKFFPRNRVAFTQEEESIEAIKLVESKVNKINASGKPLSSDFLLAKYGKIFSGNLSPRLNKIAVKTKALGAESCKRLRENDLDTAPYFSQFLNQYCVHWGVSSGRSPASLDNLKLRELYSHVSITANIKGLPS